MYVCVSAVCGLKKIFRVDLHEEGNNNDNKNLLCVYICGRQSVIEKKS